MNPVLQALNAGSNAEDVLSFLTQHFPKLRKKIAYAVSSGTSLEGILDHLGKLDKKKFDKVAKSDLSSIDESTFTRKSGRRLTQAEQAQVIEAKKEEEFKSKAKKVAGTAAVVAGGIGAGMAIRSLLSRGTGAIMPSEILPAQRAIPYTSPKQLTGPQRRLGLPAPGQTAGVQKPPPTPNIQPSGPTIPMGMQQTANVPAQTASKAMELVEKHQFMPHIQELSKNLRNPAQIAAVLYSQFPKEMQALQREAGQPMENVIAEVMQSMPQQQPEQKPIQRQEQQPQQMPIQTSEMPSEQTIKQPKIKEAAFGGESLKKLSETKPLKERSFAIPTYKFKDESPEEFKNREIINSAVEKAADALRQEKTFLDFPNPWGNIERTEKTISRGPRKGVVEKTAKVKDRFARSAAVDVLRHIAGIPNVFDPLLDDEEREELNNALEEAGFGNIKAAIPSGDANIYGATQTPNMVWNLLLTVEPRLQEIGKPKSVKGNPKSAEGEMGTTELRRNLAHALSGVLSGKNITTKLVDKIEKVSHAAQSIDSILEARKLNEIIERQEELLENDEEFYNLFTDEIFERAKRIK